MGQDDTLHRIGSALTGALEAFGRFMAAAAVAIVEHGPEVLAGLAELQVDAEHAQLLESEWANHPLLDFIKWQEAAVAQIMALTLPEESIAGHAGLARLLRPSSTADEVLNELGRVVQAPELAGFAADEFLDGLAYVRAGKLARSLTRLTVGLEGLIRTSAINRGLLTATEARKLESGNELVKQLWPERSGYKPYMKSWVFGMANVYRHGGDTGVASEQALHALCGAAIWADEIMGEPAAFERIREALDLEVTHQYAAGTLQLQSTADARLRRAAEAAQRSETVEQLLRSREQLLEVRRRSPVAPQLGGRI